MLDRQVLIGEWTARQVSMHWPISSGCEHPLQWSSEVFQQVSKRGRNCTSSDHYKGNGNSICVAHIHETWRSGMARIVKGYHSFYLHTLCFIRKRNELYPPLPSQPQLVLPTPEGWKAE